MINEESCLYEKISGEINLLIGADYAGKLLTWNVKHLSRGVIAVHTLLAWTVMGKSDIKGPYTNSSLLVLSLHVNDAKITDLWQLDTLGIHDSSETRSKTETQQLALKHFRETVSRDNTGRYKKNDFHDIKTLLSSSTSMLFLTLTWKLYPSGHGPD
ncbi:uncharacterized protein NPIL_278501 [Nephila pilipes]|uniref:Uncharacterized protein n=1 Tax=Nephila pilipes TaxID=299642 RepID=A0A8X6UJW2_NEPPI|nr:uncharacterized protein NPIL_278501 [Nephila pilipes]